MQAAMRKPDDMSKPVNARKPSAAAAREDRLKAALKANMARRKAQAKARTGNTSGGDTKNE